MTTRIHIAIVAALLAGCLPSIPNPEELTDDFTDISDMSSETGLDPLADMGGPECDSSANDGDGRRGLADMECFDGACSGRWVGGFERSAIVLLEDLEGFELDLGLVAEVWPCDSAPDIDACYVIDQVGHYICGRIECEYLVTMAPACAIPTLDGWADAGNGMVAATL